MSFPAFGSSAPQLKRRPRFSELFDIPGVSAPPVGPDIQPMPITPVPPLESLSDPAEEEKRQRLRESVGDLAGRAVGGLMKMRAPDLKPSGINPLGAVPQKGGKFLGLFGDGGRLQRAGDAAVVGESGPELLRRQRGGGVEVIPLGDASPTRFQRLLEQSLATSPQPSAPLAAAPQASISARPFSRFLDQFNGGTLAAADDPQMPPAAVRPRRFTRDAPPPAVAELTARAQGAGQPVDAGSPSPLAAAPSPMPMIPPFTRAPSEFQSLAVPVTGRPGARSRPAFGEEETNDANVRARIEAAGGFTEGGDLNERPRINDQRGFLRKRLAEIEAAPVSTNTNSRFKGFLKSAGYGALRGMASNPQNPLAGAIGGAAGAGIVGAIDKTTDERLGEGFAADRMRGRLGAMDAREAEGLKLEDQRAGVRLKNARAGYAEQRPEIEAAKLAGVEQNRRVTAFFRKMNLVKGQRLDPEHNARHARLLEEGAALGVEVDPESWNESKGNMVRYTRTDPDHPERTQVVQRNVLTGEESILGQGGFQAPRNAEGMTTAEVRVDEDRDRTAAALERQRKVSNEILRAGVNLRREGFDFDKLKYSDKLSEDSRKEMGDAAKMRADAERAQMNADSYGQILSQPLPADADDDAKKQRAIVQSMQRASNNRAEALRRQYFQSFGYLHEDNGGEMKMTLDEFRQLFPNAPNPMATAPAYGIVLSDSTQPGTPHTNTYPPRRGAPHSSTTAPSSATPQPRGRVSRANFDKVRAQNPSLQGKSDADVEAALKAMGIEVY